MNGLVPGVKVAVIGDNHELRRGVIKDVFEGLSLAIVDFGDGCVEKVHFYKMAIEPEVREEKSSKSIEKSEITITPGEFSNIAMRVLVDVIDDTSIRTVNLVSLFAIIVTRLHRAMFFEGDND